MRGRFALKGVEEGQHMLSRKYTICVVLAFLPGCYSEFYAMRFKEPVTRAAELIERSLAGQPCPPDATPAERRFYEMRTVPIYEDVNISAGAPESIPVLWRDKDRQPEDAVSHYVAVGYVSGEVASAWTLFGVKHVEQAFRRAAIAVEADAVIDVNGVNMWPVQFHYYPVNRYCGVLVKTLPPQKHVLQSGHRERMMQVARRGEQR